MGTVLQNGFLNQVKPLCTYKHITVYGNDTLLRFNGCIRKGVLDRSIQIH